MRVVDFVTLARLIASEALYAVGLPKIALPVRPTGKQMLDVIEPIAAAHKKRFPQMFDPGSDELYDWAPRATASLLCADPKHDYLLDADGNPFVVDVSRLA